MQNSLFFLVAESYVLKLNFTFKRNIRNAAVVVRMFPCPLPGRQKCFCNCAVIKNICIDQRYIAAVNFGFFINYGKDTLCTGKSVQNAVEHLRHLRNRVLKAARIFKERRDFAQIHFAGNNQHYTGNCRNCIAYVPHVVHKRAENICKRVCSCTGVAEPVIQGIKFGFRNFLAAKDFYNFLPFNHFFYITVYFADCFLLFSKSFCRMFADNACYGNHRHNSKNYKQRQKRAKRKHHHKTGNNSQQRRKKLRHSLAQHITDSVNIVCKAAHKLAM